ncbi:MAG: LptF/LptG family permease [Verrucomicrobia bacterium]|nr:LptF/LptG family permease [Verrucomicrobiota bacterium]
MRLLDRYLLRELLIPLGYCLSGFLIFWVSSDLFNMLDDFQEKKLLLRDILQYYLVTAPEFLVLVLPMALLLALLYALTNHARHHELIAMRAAGISLWRLCLPYLAVGCVFALVYFALNELWVPNSVEAAERILNRRVQKQASPEKRNIVRNLGLRNFRDDRTWHIGTYHLRTHEMENVIVEWKLPDGARRELYAQRGVRIDKVWTFSNALELTFAPGTTMLTNRNQTALLAVPEFTETPEQIKSEISFDNRNLVARNADLPLVDIFNYKRLHPHLARSDRNWLYTQLHGRLAAPWTCLVVVLIAIPFAASSARRNVFVGVASSISICFIYFVLLRLGLALGSGGYVPPWLAAWFPNVSFGICGLWLTARVR